MNDTSSWIRRAQHPGGIDRIEAFFRGNAYAMHRHDTYAIGRTLRGVQSFHYRKDLRHSLAGHTIVLHPDESHDGHASSDDGFAYRMVYIEPALLQQALAGRALPFIANGVSTDPRLRGATDSLLQSMDTEIDALERDDAIFDLATAMLAVSGASQRRDQGDFRSAQIAREYIDEALGRTVTLEELEAVSGQDRWRLSRDFRRFFGTSPYRYLTMRRLDLVRRLMLVGRPLAECAAMAGFADQSHMTRQFVKTYGLSPWRWLQISRAAR